MHLIDSVDPKRGGPVEYARIVADAHAKKGHHSLFVTLDAPTSLVIKEFPHTLYAAGPAQGLLRSNPRFALTVEQLATQVDAAVVHGLWTHASIGAYWELRKAQVPWVVFAHGMLSPYFRRTKPIKHLIKQLYWWLWLGRVLRDSKMVLFSCAEERRLAQNMFLGFGGYKEREIAFCSADLNDQIRVTKTSVEGARAMNLGSDKTGYYLFVGRIDPIKSLDTLIRAYARLAPRPDCPDLVIAGPDTVGWQATLQRISAELGVRDRVHFPGMISGSTKAAAFAGADAFVLPSHQENFGLVVAEALSVGTPVLLSDKVNIWREVVKAGAGLAEPDTVAGTERLLQRFLDLTEAERATLKAAARPCYETHFSPKAAAEDLLAVLENCR